MYLLFRLVLYSLEPNNERLDFMEALGRHIIVEYYECNSQILNDALLVEEKMVEAAERAGATVINSTFHHFSPYGVSGVVVIEESHLAIHTWPEYGFASVDLFTCGEQVNPWAANEYLQGAFESSHRSAMEMRRGQLSSLQKRDFNVVGKLRDEAQINIPTQVKHKRDIWFTERDDKIALSLKHEGRLFSSQSQYQKVEIYDTLAYGKMLTLDGMVMTTEKDEYVYHEMIAHIPMLSHQDPKKILVIGAGDGGTVRELLKHERVEEIVMVEIDQVVIDACKLHLPDISIALKNSKLNLLVEDGIEFVKQSQNESYDVVIVDSTDPVGPGEGLFSREFYENVYRILKSDGILVTQSESPRFNQKVFQEIYECYRGIFGREHVHCYLVAIPSYPTGNWSFSISTKGSNSPIEVDKERVKMFCDGEKLKYYNEDIHFACFALPNYVRELLS